MENNKVTQMRRLPGNGTKNLIATRKCDVLKHPQVHGLLQYSLYVRMVESHREDTVM